MHGVYAFGLEGVLVQQLVLGGEALFDGQVALFEGGDFAADVGQDEEPLVVDVSGQGVVTLVGEFHRVELFVDDEVEVVGHLVHAFAVVLHVEVFGLLHQGFHAGFGEKFDKRLVFGQSFVDGQQQFAAFGVVAFGDHFAGFGQQRGAEVALQTVERFDLAAVLFEELVFAAGHGAGDDQGGTRVVDQHGVHLVDDGVVVRTLYQVAGFDGHVVAQVVETEFVVGTEGDVAVVSAAAFVGVGLVLVDAIHGQAVELVDGPHPFGVAPGEVVVHGHHMDAFACQGIQEHGQGGHEGFPFAGGHFGHVPAVEGHAAEELHVVMDHVPRDFVSAGCPMVPVEGFVAVDRDEVLAFGGQLAVGVGGGHRDGLVLGETPRGVFNDGEDLGQDFVQHGFDGFVHVLFEAVDFGGDALFFVDFHVGFFELGFQFDDAVFVLFEALADQLPEFGHAGAQLVVGKPFDFGINGQDLVHNRLDGLTVFVGLASEKHLQQACCYTHILGLSRFN